MKTKCRLLRVNQTAQLTTLTRRTNSTIMFYGYIYEISKDILLVDFVLLNKKYNRGLLLERVVFRMKAI